MNDLEQMWYLLDIVWDNFGCNNISLNWDQIGKFYSHPVWPLNGLFIENHRASMDQRHAISDWIVNSKFDNIVEFEGGFGTLVSLIAQKNDLKIDVYELHPSAFGLKRLKEYNNISFIKNLN